MAYIKQTWNTGDTITAEKLNHMEDGIASLSGYDFVLTDGLNGFSADGLSVDEMKQKGAQNLKACYLNGAIACDAVNKIVSIFSVGFCFVDFTSEDLKTSIDLAKDGTCSYYANGATHDFTYTYADGHYTFTPSNP